MIGRGQFRFPAKKCNKHNSKMENKNLASLCVRDATRRIWNEILFKGLACSRSDTWLWETSSVAGGLSVLLSPACFEFDIQPRPNRVCKYNSRLRAGQSWWPAKGSPLSPQWINQPQVLEHCELLLPWCLFFKQRGCVKQREAFRFPLRFLLDLKFEQANSDGDDKYSKIDKRRALKMGEMAVGITDLKLTNCLLCGSPKLV